MQAEYGRVINRSGGLFLLQVVISLHPLGTFDVHLSKLSQVYDAIFSVPMFSAG